MDKKNKFSIILITILLVSNLLLFKMVDSVDKKIMDIQYQNIEVRQDIDSISKNVNDSVKELTDEQRWLKLESKNIVNFSENLVEAEVKIKWSLRELNEGDKVYLIYGAYDDNPSEVEKWEILLVNDENNLNYEKNLTLSTSRNYYFKVEVKNNSKTIIENLANIEIKEMFENRIQIQTYLKTRSNTHIDISMNIVNDNNLMENDSNDLILSEDIKNKLKIKNIKYKIYVGEEEIASKYILKDGLEEIEGLIIENNGVEIIDYDESIDIDNDIQAPAKIVVYVEDYFDKKYEKVFEIR